MIESIVQISVGSGDANLHALRKSLFPRLIDGASSMRHAVTWHSLKALGFRFEDFQLPWISWSRTQRSTASGVMADEEEDDYMNFAIKDLAPSKESSLQRTARQKKEAAERGRIPSKAEKAAKAKADRDAALATELDSSNKGAKMMAKMGFKGGTLGKSEDARKKPIELLIKDDKGGIGMDSDKKRKIRDAAEAAEDGEKRQKVGLDEFRERNRSEREEKRAEGLMWGAMKVLEGFEERQQANGEDGGEDGVSEVKTGGGNTGTEKKHLRDVNVLYRLLLKGRLEKDRDRKMRHELNNSLSMRNEDESDDEKPAPFDSRIDELDDEDSDLAEFEALPVTERLGKVIQALREKYQYCFWCKYRYSDAEMDGCPGLTEDEHG